MSDLAEKILAAIEAKEKSLPSLEAEPWVSERREGARRCAADREIVADYQYAMKQKDNAAHGPDGMYVWARVSMALEKVIILLARGYGIQP